MKAVLNYVIALVLIIGTATSFTQCQEDLVPDDLVDAQYQNANGNTNVTMSNGNATTSEVCVCLAEKFAMEDLSEAERDALLLMREEEKMARDVYSYLYDKWNHRVFDNIGKAEERHMQAVLCLIERYGVKDPVADNGPGEFVNEQLAELYATLIDKGRVSLAAAMEVGATIEDVDIADLVRLMDGGTLDNADILAVFAELTKGSRNHLRAFVRQLTISGSTYVPQFITEQYFTEIINTDQERSGAICDGMINCQNSSPNSSSCMGDQSGSCTGVCSANGSGNGQHKKGGPN
jgi:hypothetical protein